jgi:(E)-4-hydroxy-3-methylbut-2-enyl-diphosphate synthase
MWKERLAADALDSVLTGLLDLRSRGCDIVRFAVPDVQSADLLGTLARNSPLPIVADVHFDYRIALRCLEHPIAKVRINPGNIGAEWKAREVFAKAKDSGVSVRIGINSGSLPKNLIGESDVPRAMLKAAESEMELLERLDFHDVVFSLKSSAIEETVAANELFASMCDFPLHIGITEAGPLIPGIVKSAIGLSTLLEAGIGDTIRVSLSASPADEIAAGMEIVKSATGRADAIEVVSCPTCGRSTFDVQSFLEKMLPELQKVRKPLTVAVMGCPVNGPGEARRAELGITGAGKLAIIFRDGEIIRRVPYESAADVFREELDKICENL